jgi:hypothetical protein
MSEKRATDAELVDEARRWDSGELTPAGWKDAPEAVPRVNESNSMSIRVPAAMVAILEGYARRAGIGCQVLIKQWLDERIRAERELSRAHRTELS